MAGYGTNAGFDTWLAAEGYVLSEAAPTRDVLRQRGSVYIDGLYGRRFPGSPTDGLEQDRQWPRTGATAYGTSIADDVIPAAVITASYYAAYQEALSPGALSAQASGSAKLKREKIDVLEREFFEGTGDDLYNATPRFGYIEGLLSPFLTAWAGGYGAILVV